MKYFNKSNVIQTKQLQRTAHITLQSLLVISGGSGQYLHHNT